MDFNGLKDKLLAKIGQATESAKDFADKAADTTKDLATKAAEKAKAGGRIAKLNLELAQEKENMKKAYLEIGKLYYDTHKDDAEGFFIQLCEEVAAAEQAIADKEAEIAALKEEFNSKNPDVDVEFEEIVAEDEAAAEAAEVAEVVEDVAEVAEEIVEEIVEEIKDEVEE